jgi:hypothetical protein
MGKNCSKTPKRTHKKCADCKKTFRVSHNKKLSKFQVRRSRACGRLSWRYSPRCKSCDWKWQARRKCSGIKYRACAPLPPQERRLRQLARHAVCNAVHWGSLKKPKACSRCHKKVPPVDLHAHHKDYTKRLAVHWICRRCHQLKEGIYDHPELRDSVPGMMRHVD